MRRRALLSAVASTTAAALAAGCTSPPPGTDSAPTTTTTTTPEPSTVPEPGPDADLAITEFAVETEKTGPTGEWYLRIEGVYSTDAVGRHFEDPAVVDVADVEDADVREAVKRVLDEGKVWVDEIPDDLRAFVDETDLVTWEADTDAGDVATHWSLAVYEAHPDRDPVLEFDVDVLDSGVGGGGGGEGSPAELEFSVANTGDVEQSVYGGVVRPFGVPRVHHPGEPDGPSFLLWWDYESVDGVSVTDDGVTRNAIGTMTPVAPSETLTRTYRLAPSKPQCDAVGPGEWAYEDALEYGPSGEAQGPGATVEYRLEFTIEDV
jgi:hypothetical protein